MEGRFGGECELEIGDEKADAVVGGDEGWGVGKGRTVDDFGLEFAEH